MKYIFQSNKKEKCIRIWRTPQQRANTKLLHSGETKRKKNFKVFSEVTTSQKKFFNCEFFREGVRKTRITKFCDVIMMFSNVIKWCKLKERNRKSEIKFRLNNAIQRRPTPNIFFFLVFKPQSGEYVFIFPFFSVCWVKFVLFIVFLW